MILFLRSGCCAAQKILPDGPVDAILGRNVTLTTLIKDMGNSILSWSFHDGEKQIPVATVSPTTSNIGPLYEGRASINRSNGFLYLSGLKPEDSGDYTVTFIPPDLTTRTSIIELRVLGEYKNKSFLSFTSMPN